MFPSTQFHGNRQLPALEVPSSSTVQTHAPSKKNYLVSPDTIFNSSSLEKLFSGEQLFFNNGRLRASYDCADEVIRLCSDHPKYGKYSNVESVWLTKENPLAEVKRDTLQLLIKENLFLPELPEAKKLSSQAPAQLAAGSSVLSGGNSSSRFLKTAPARATAFTNNVILTHLKFFLLVAQISDTGERSKEMAIAAKNLNDGIALLRNSIEGTGLMASLESIKRACDFFCKAPPCEQVDIRAAMSGMLDTKARRTQKPSVAIQELVEWCRQGVAIIQSLYDLVDHAHEIPDLPPAMASKVEGLCNVGLHQLATGLCENADQLDNLIRTQRAALAHVNSLWQSKLDKSLSPKLSLEALSSTERSHSNAIHLTKEVSDFATLIEYVVDPFGERRVCNATSECLTNAVLKSNLLRMAGSRLALNAHLDRLKLIAAAASTFRDPMMKELVSVAGQAKHVQSGIEDFIGKRSIDATKGVKFRLLEHLSWQCHDIEVNLRHMSSQLSASTALQWNASAIDALRNTADAFGAVKVVVQDYMGNIPGKEALSLEEEQHLDSLKTEFFKSYVEEPEATGDLAGLAISAASAGASTEARPAKQAASPSLAWIEDTPLSSAGTAKPSRQRKGKAKTASKVKSTPAASDMQKTTLQRAHERLAEAVNHLPNLKNNALGYAQIQLDKARHVVEHPGDNPVIVARVKSYVARACDTLERSALAISEQLRHLREAKDRIQELEPESATKADLMRNASSQEEDWLAQIDALRTRGQELHAEAEALGRAQMINIFLAHPTYESYKTLANWSSLDNSNVALTAEKNVERKLLPSTTVLGFEKPNADFLDVYSITVRTRKSDAPAWQVAGRVEFHTHYDRLEKSEAPKLGHFKNEIQAGLSGPSVYRGRVSKFELASLVDDISDLANDVL